MHASLIVKQIGYAKFHINYLLRPSLAKISNQKYARTSLPYFSLNYHRPPLLFK